MHTHAPIFIVGANRSGTTLLRLILNAHSRIAIPEELNYFNTWMAEHWREETADREAFRGRVHWYLQSKLPPGAFGDTDVSALEEDIVAQASVYDWRAVYEGLLTAWARHHGKIRWGEKTPGNLFYVDTLRAMFPEAQFIHLVRDPRAGVLSMQNASFFGDDMVINALNRRKYLREGLRRDATMPPDKWTRVRYEDLLTAPEDTVRALCIFLGERYHPSMLTYYEDAERYMSPAAAQKFNRAARRPIDPKKADSWRDALPPADAALIGTICRREMEALGYAPLADTAPPLTTRLAVPLKVAYWRLADSRCDAPEYIVGTSPSTHLRRLPTRLQLALARLSPLAPSPEEAPSD